MSISSAPCESSGIATRVSWGFSGVLLVIYLLTFHAWLMMPTAWVAPSGWIIAVLLTALLVAAAKRRSFVNTFDQVCHGVVILDLWLEAVWVRWHEGYSFYGCAAAFALVLGCYRLWMIREASLPLPNQAA
ncbi:MAG: hypothetical protein FJ404_02345 [Verrucomicrobia bacterium]|nr:hypothetical protein [Verrucomicrobiota bacterium]